MAAGSMMNNPFAFVATSLYLPGGSLFVGDQLNSSVRQINISKASNDVFNLRVLPPGGGSADAGIRALFNLPSGVAADGQNNLYVQDGYTHRIRKITPGGVDSIFAGPPASVANADARGLLDGPAASARFDFTGCLGPGLAVGPDGALYVADTGNNRIRRIKDGMVTTLAGSGASRDLMHFQDGAGDVARFNAPQGLAVAVDGTVYVADTGNNRIRAIK